MLYADADARLTGRCRESRKVGNHTYLKRRGDDIAVMLHETNVVTIHPDDSMTLSTGGWYTVTTKDRINTYLPSGLSVGSDRGRWHLYRWVLDEVERYAGSRSWVKGERFHDGMTVTQAGTVVGPVDPVHEAYLQTKEERMRKAITNYVRGYMRALRRGMPIPSGADCWGCSLVASDGRTDPLGTSHLREHLRERYYVPSLLQNAFRERGYRDADTALLYRLDYDAYRAGTMRMVDRGYTSDVSRNLRRFLSKRLLPDLAHR